MNLNSQRWSLAKGHMGNVGSSQKTNVLSAKALFRKFLQEATSASYKDAPFWEHLRKTITPTKFETVDEMFARWNVLAGITKKTNRR